MKGKVANELVPMIEGTIQNQPCIYGELVEGHSVYCDNPKSSYRKCRCSWYFGRAGSILDECADEDCKYFKPNPNYKDCKELPEDIIKLYFERIKNQIEYDQLVAEGWLCLKCVEALPLKDGYAYCNAGTLVTGKVKFKEDKKYTDEEIGRHFELDPMRVKMRKKCQFFVETPNENKTR